MAIGAARFEVDSHGARVAAVSSQQHNRDFNPRYMNTPPLLIEVQIVLALYDYRPDAADAKGRLEFSAGAEIQLLHQHPNGWQVFGLIFIGLARE